MEAEVGRRAVEDIRYGLVVSCQAHGDHPLRDARIIGALAACAEKGGAAGIRADGPQDIEEVNANVSLPIIGIHKTPLSDARFFITPTFEHARSIVNAGADVVVLEATFENRPDGRELEDLLGRIREELKVPVMADVSTFEEGVRAREAGADLVATTLSGYTRESQNREQPDLELVGALADAGVCVVCEGHIRTPYEVGAAFERGAWAVVVGTAITDPVSITSCFAEGARGRSRGGVPEREARP